MRAAAQIVLLVVELRGRKRDAFVELHTYVLRHLHTCSGSHLQAKFAAITTLRLENSHR